MNKIAKNLLGVFLYIFLLMAIILLIYNNEIIKETIFFSGNIWINSLVPSLFPILFIVNILILYNVPNKTSYIFKPFSKLLFNLNSNSIFIFIMSLLTGFLGGAKYIVDLYNKDKIDIISANKLLMFTHFGNPLFVISFIGINIFNNIKIGIIIFVIQLISNLLIGILIRPKKVINDEKQFNIFNKTTFGKIFSISIKDTFSTLLMILGSMTITLIFINIISNTFSLNTYIDCFIKSLFEVTSGINAISTLNCSLLLKIFLINLCLTFGGINIHLQVISLLEGSKIKYKYFFIGRILASIISSILVLLYFIMNNL